MKRVSIIIPAKDKLSRLLLVLKALEPQVDESVEVIIIFDGCNRQMIDEFRKIEFSCKPVMLVHERTLGRARARNSGILASCGEIALFLDDDRIPCPDFIARHLDRHEKERCAVIGKRYNLHYTEEKINRLGRRGFSAADFEMIRQEASREKFDWIKVCCQCLLGNLLDCVTFTTGNSSVRRKDLLEVGMFDEKFSGWGVEDVDLGYRLIKAGVKIRRDYAVCNYHLVHPVDHGRQKEDYWRNFYYFAEKIRNDKAALFIANLVNIFSPYN